MADRRSSGLGGALAVALAALGLLAACTAPADRTATSSTATSSTATMAGTTTAGTTTSTTTSTTTTSTTTSTPTTSTPTTSTPTTSTTTTVSHHPMGRPLRLLVVGDSVAASLAGDDRMERFTIAGVAEVEVANLGSVACPVIFDGDWWFTDGSTLPDNPVCDRPERYDHDVATFAPDVVLTVFGWPGVGGGQRFSDGTIARPCEPRFDEAWRSGYEQMIERLAPHALVVAATVAPVALDTRRPETRCLNEIVRQLPAIVFDLQDWLCPELDCSERAELRTDGVHFADEPQLRRAAMHGILAQIVPLV